MSGIVKIGDFTIKFENYATSVYYKDEILQNVREVNINVRAPGNLIELTLTVADNRTDGGETYGNQRAS